MTPKLIKETDYYEVYEYPPHSVTGKIATTKAQKFLCICGPNNGLYKTDFSCGKGYIRYNPANKRMYSSHLECVFIHESVLENDT